MKHFYSEIHEVILTFSDIHETRDGMEYIRIYFERPNNDGFDFLESTLPSLEIKKTYGFSQEEITKLLDYARINAFIMWDIARESAESARGGEKIAASL